MISNETDATVSGRRVRRTRYDDDDHSDGENGSDRDTTIRGENSNDVL